MPKNESNDFSQKVFFRAYEKVYPIYWVQKSFLKKSLGSVFGIYSSIYIFSEQIQLIIFVVFYLQEEMVIIRTSYDISKIL